MWLFAVDQVNGNLPYELTAGSHVVGRSKDCDLTIRHPTLSRQHVRIWVNEQNQVTVKDLESKNGTFVNEVRVQQIPLRASAILRLGDVRFSVSAAAPELSAELVDETRSAKGSRPSPVASLPIENLTPAQKQVFDLMVAGCDEAAVAELLKRSFHTIHQHVQAIFRKLGIHSRAELLSTVIRSQHKLPADQSVNPGDAKTVSNRRS